MKIEKLDWDSQFFGFGIAKIPTDNITEKVLTNILLQAKKENIKLLYWFIAPDNENLNLLAIKFNAFLADEKTTFIKSISNQVKAVSTNISRYNPTVPNAELYSLSQQSAEFSRFKMDGMFPANACENLYIQWIINSVNKKIADSVLVFEQNEKITGMITLKAKDNMGYIGLIGVDTQMRGMQIGTKLIESAEHYFAQKTVNTIEVVTQRANIKACNFYIKNGFSIKQIENVYHLWI